MRVVDLSQGSLAWSDWRRIGIGASDSPIIIHGEHFGKDRLFLWKEKLGLIKREQGSWAMQQGRDSEAATRKWYEAVTGFDAQPLCAVHDTEGYLKTSLDGYVGAPHYIVVEIKYASKSRHDLALSGEVPEEYKPQLNHQILVTDARMAHYCSFNPRYPIATRYAIVEYVPEEKDLERHLRLLKSFWRCVIEKTPPVDEDFTVERDLSVRTCST